MEFQTKVQRECYQQVATWMEEMFDKYPWEKLDEPGFGLFMGSAWVEVRIHPWQQDAAIETRSHVVRGAEITPELMQFLLRKNAELHIGGFGLLFDNTIVYQHSITGTNLDENELVTSVNTVAVIADHYDDLIVEKSGGKRATDVVEDLEN